MNQKQIAKQKQKQQSNKQAITQVVDLVFIRRVQTNKQ